MPRFRAIATMTTFAEVVIVAPDEQSAYEIADAMDGADFIEIPGEGGWSIEVIQL